MGEHLIDGKFQSDKYPTTPRGKVPLSVKDPLAHDLLWEYARRRQSTDSEFSADLREALLRAGYVPPDDGKYLIRWKGPQRESGSSWFQSFDPVSKRAWWTSERALAFTFKPGAAMNYTVRLWPADLVAIERAKCGARSWTGRVCALAPHLDNLHQCSNEFMWRGNADEVPLVGASTLPSAVRLAYLTHFEYHDRYCRNQLSEGEFLRLAEGSYFALLDALADQCGVTQLWNELNARYWAGEWPTDLRHLEGFIHLDSFMMMNCLDLLGRHNMLRGRPWGCAEAEPWEW